MPYHLCMIVVTHATLRNPSVLETRSLPKRFLGRVMLWPRRSAGGRMMLRMILEVQILRFILSLLPFIAAMLIWPRYALPLAQAPLAMILVIGAVEMRLLRYPPETRKSLLPQAEVERMEDLLRFRALRCLTKIAARHGLKQGALILVIEQAEMARVMPLTLVSVQSNMPVPRVLALQAADRALLQAALFDAELTEKALLLASFQSSNFLRSFAFETRGVSAHARLAAVLEKRGEREVQA
ncbi:hypothetical protein P775_21750 [Puniceibacterium antarcticum]|uniref:Uncharacterized protein n=1 Tax=Puniceibacterium antarcticum TaxID=1206336 RepID=A0A2G8R943_9RHOB|nr:hypothetical protein [Puniceibacterium antarcticum]PIL18049.1 hypothetical protein P775_21750 [Puniceibacterium antarcticum]